MDCTAVISSTGVLGLSSTIGLRFIFVVIKKGKKTNEGKVQEKNNNKIQIAHDSRIKIFRIVQ